MTLPLKLTDILAKLSDLEEKYIARRSDLDKQRFLGNWRWSTENTERKNDCKFIGTVVGWVGDQSNRLEYLKNYGDDDPQLSELITSANASSLNEDEKDKVKRKMYEISICPFLRQAILGAVVLTLSKITKSYTGARLSGCDEATVKSYSGLAYVLLNEFNLEKLSDIDASERLSYLKSLDRLIKVLDAGHKKNKSLEAIQWHPSYTNEVLLQQLSSEIASLELEKVSAIVETKALSCS